MTARTHKGFARRNFLCAWCLSDNDNFCVLRSARTTRTRLLEQAAVTGGYSVPSHSRTTLMFCLILSVVRTGIQLVLQNFFGRFILLTSALPRSQMFGVSVMPSIPAHTGI